MLNILVTLLLLSCGTAQTNNELTPTQTQTKRNSSEENIEIFNANINKEEQLYKAAANGWDDIVENLLESGANIDDMENNGDNQTPLHIAIVNCHVTTAQLLIRKGANVNLLSKRHPYVTPLYDALTQFHTADIEPLLILLLKNGADPNVRIKSAQKPVFWEVIDSFIHQQDRDVCKSHIRQLINNPFSEINGDINAVNRNQQTALHYIINKYHLKLHALILEDIIDFLVELGANVKMQDGDGNTPLHILWGKVSDENFLESFILAKDLLSNIEVKNNNGNTPYDLIKNTTVGHRIADTYIMNSISENRLDMLKMFWEIGMRPHCKVRVNDFAQYTPMSLARGEKLKDIQTFLAKQGMFELDPNKETF